MSRSGIFSGLRLEKASRSKVFCVLFICSYSPSCVLYQFVFISLLKSSFTRVCSVPLSIGYMNVDLERQ